MPAETLELSAPESRRIHELLQALRSPVETWVNPSSALLTAEFATDFQSRLLAQHVFMRSIVSQASFDAAFLASASAAGIDIEPAPDGQRFWDAKLDGRKVSLKSTQAKNLALSKLHISKLTEAAWIQDCRTAKARMQHVRGLFTEYIGTVAAIYQLRYFQRSYLYELVEIPVDLLSPILTLRVSEFQADGPTINIPVGQIPPDFTLKLDRSDAKITLANIAKARCIVHGSWKMPCSAIGD